MWLRCPLQIGFAKSDQGNFPFEFLFRSVLVVHYGGRHHTQNRPQTAPTYALQGRRNNLNNF